MQEYATLSSAQLDLIQRLPDGTVFLEGPAGCGKTTAGVERLVHLMEQGVPASSILLLVPQRTLAAPYYHALNTPGVVAGGMVTVLTVGGLAQRMVELFWPLAAGEAGFARPDLPPTFLTLETAQYSMAHLVRPLLDEGYFDSVTIQRNRLYSQILDNLNKAALVGFPYTEIGERLKSAWAGDPGQARVYADAQFCATHFRQYCLEHNLLDFSLQLEVFLKYLWPAPLCRQYLVGMYRHLLFDNLEEDTPAAHDLLREWLPHFTSALLIYDHSAGYRRFLGAEPQGGAALGDLCAERILFDYSFISSAPIKNLGHHLVGAIAQPGSGALCSAEEVQAGETGDPAAALEFGYHRFFPQMLDWAAGEIARLVHEEGVPPDAIVVLAPYLSDALRFSLTARLEGLGVPTRSQRPSRSLREEPATRCLLTLVSLAHPSWGIHPPRYDVAYALVQAIESLDLVRAQLLVDIVYRMRKGVLELSPFEQIKADVQERITYRCGELYDALRLWLAEYGQGPEVALDHFLSRLFGELLSQPGFGFHASLEAGEVAANLVESVQKFRWAAGSLLAEEDIPHGKEYLLMVQDGVIAAQYIRSWRAPGEGAVLLAPAYTFLMSNYPVDYQFWLDGGSSGWFERLFQPLTHPYVLSRRWSQSRQWTADEEYEASADGLARLILGLLRRCRSKVYLGISELGEQGYEQRGPLLRAVQRVLRRSPGAR
jgi:hypothetical protein